MHEIVLKQQNHTFQYIGKFILPKFMQRRKIA